jgi:hypothetical protein
VEAKNVKLVNIALFQIHKVNNEECQKLHSLPNIIRMIKSRRMRWAGHGARLGEKRSAYSVFIGKP